MIDIEGTEYHELRELPEGFFVLDLQKFEENKYRAILFRSELFEDSAAFCVENIAECDAPEIAIEAVLEATPGCMGRVWLRRRQGRVYGYWQPDAITLTEGALIELSNLEAERRLSDLWLFNPDAAQAECMVALVGGSP